MTISTERLRALEAIAITASHIRCVRTQPSLSNEYGTEDRLIERLIEEEKAFMKIANSESK